jgi:subtilisin family serine protease
VSQHSRNRRAVERLRARAARAGVLVGSLSAIVAASAWADEPPCPPIEAPRTFAQLAPNQEPGVMGSHVGVAEGPIVSLTESPSEKVAQQASGEALLVLPKRPDGTLAHGYELARGARIADSFWSPVLCATIARVVGDPLTDPYDLVAKLPSDAAVAPNHIYTSAAEDVKPTPDAYRKLQHALDQLGVDRARSVSIGAGVRVAVLDSAPQTDHPDLPAVRVVPLVGGPHGIGVHGTLTTGVIAAIANNGFGIAGVAPAAEVIAIPVCTPIGASPRDSCGLFDLLRGLDLAWEQHAQVMNLSLVGPANPLLERAANRLDDLGAIVVAAAGNEGVDAPRYPAAYPSVVGVGALDVKGVRYDRSNGGASAQIWAPGVEVLSTVPGGAFSFASGTSFAAAHVTGALAVLIGSGATPDAARRALFQTARASSAPSPRVAPLCNALEQLGHACPAS